MPFDFDSPNEAGNALHRFLERNLSRIMAAMIGFPIAAYAFHGGAEPPSAADGAVKAAPGRVVTRSVGEPRAASLNGPLKLVSASADRSGAVTAEAAKR